MTRPLLVLRAEPGATRTAERARALHLQPMVLPLFEAVTCAWDAPSPDEVAALAFTSAQAPRLAGPTLHLYRHLPAYVVGPSTAAAARAVGFARVVEGPRDAAALAGLIARDAPGPALHLCGAEHRPLSPMFRVVYAMRPREVVLPDEAGAAVALLHSGAVARAWAAAVDRAGLRRAGLTLAAISRAAAAAAGGGWERVDVAPEPRDPPLLALAAALCNNARTQ